MKLSTVTARTRPAAFTAGVAATLMLLTATPASAAGAPDQHAPCLAYVFQAQAVEAPQTVARRIQEIRALYLGDAPFGQALKPLTTLPYNCPE